ncbi:MAG: OmpA family protein [Syntrophobacteraceae bacterium]
MRRGWLLLVVFCAFAMAACAGANTRSDNVGVPAAADTLDKQKLELQACLAGYEGAEVERHEGSLSIVMRCDSLFELQSARMNPVTCGRLDSVAEVVKKYSDTRVKVDAHTDCIRSEEENLEISEMQAGAVKEVLVGRGVLPARVTSRGWGEAKPAASNATEAGRQTNRRVTITLIPGQS